MRNWNRSQRGFALLQVVLVVGLVGILAATVFAVLDVMQKQSTKADESAIIEIATSEIAAAIANPASCAKTFELAASSMNFQELRQALQWSPTANMTSYPAPFVVGPDGDRYITPVLLEEFKAGNGKMLYRVFEPIQNKIRLVSAIARLSAMPKSETDEQTAPSWNENGDNPGEVEIQFASIASKNVVATRTIKAVFKLKNGAVESCWTSASDLLPPGTYSRVCQDILGGTPAGTDGIVPCQFNDDQDIGTTIQESMDRLTQAQKRIQERIQ
jgi:type II secretory pathway pseudopilin PulG